MAGIAVDEDQHRVGEHAGERVGREYVIGRFEDPAPRRLARSLEMEPELPPVINGLSQITMQQFMDLEDAPNRAGEAVGRQCVATPDHLPQSFVISAN